MAEIFERAAGQDILDKHPKNGLRWQRINEYLGFKWRDKEPSGAASIEWYHRWVEKGDVAIKQRILDYNEDDCIAMRVLLYAVQKLSAKKSLRIKFN